MKNLKNLQPISSLQSLFFPVEKVEISEMIPGLETTSGLSHAIIVEPHKGKKVLVNTCSKQYSLVPNAEIIKPLADMLSGEYEIRVSEASVHDYAKTFVDLVFIKTGQQILDKDDIFAKIRLANSYDGSIKFYYNFGFYRLVCTNGLAVPIGDNQKKFKSLHVVGEDMSLGNLSDRFMRDTQDFLQKAGMLTEGFHELAQAKYRSLENAKKRIEEVLEYTDYPKKTAPLAEARLETERAMGFELSDYLIYNAMNWALDNNEESKLQTHKIELLDNQVLNFLIKY